MQYMLALNSSTQIYTDHTLADLDYNSTVSCGLEHPQMMPKPHVNNIRPSYF